MKKVAMYSTSELFGERITGGLKRFLELYKGMCERGLDVELFCRDSQETLKKNNIDGFSLKKPTSKSKIFFPVELQILVKNIGKVREILKSYDEIIIFDVPTAIGLCLLGAKGINLFIRQDLISYKEISLNSRTKNKLSIQIYLKLMKLCETICFIKSKKIIVQCEYDSMRILERHPVIRKGIENKIIVQINNVNPSWIIDKSSIKNNNIHNNTCTMNVAFIGDFNNERKGQKIFIEAFKLLVDTNKDKNYQATIIGGGESLECYKNMCKDYPQINFLGRVNNPIEVLKECDLLVVPSIADSCPNTVMEALYNNIPVIGSASGGIPEILNHSEAIFDLSRESLGKKMKEILNEHSLESLKNRQLKRKNELEFNWVETIIGHLELNSVNGE